jgi:hypothetical protein
LVSRRRKHQNSTPALADLGLPEQSALTVEGRLERANMMGTHLARALDGRERPVWHSYWSTGLWLLLGAIALVIALAVVSTFV